MAVALFDVNPASVVVEQSFIVNPVRGGYWTKNEKDVIVSNSIHNYKGGNTHMTLVTRNCFNPVKWNLRLRHLESFEEDED